ncbi:MAG: endonuclease/exonuclease/phosphatase family protein [Chitinophagaceae bacterium]|nr:endonuclease/exonuclease/phosphatase family protein [Chitinophagaceae bacterium]
MKKINLLFCSIITGITLLAQDPLNIMTFNIRYNNPGDSLNAWPNRVDKVSSQILFHEAHIIGVQEALHDQMQDLDRALTKYKYVGGARDDGKEKGEYSAIFFDTTRLQLLQSQTFWLSQTPQAPGSKGWDAAITRIVTWAKFRDKKTKKEFYHFNTHFDHIGQVARAESAKLLLKYSNEIAGKIPYIVTGDFNANQNQEPIQIILNPKDPLHLVDAKSISSTPHYGPAGTFNGFRSKETGDLPIDYIFIKQAVKVLQHATLSQTWEGRFSSDHYPVFARVVIQ